jgi:hypothetical protein
VLGNHVRQSVQRGEPADILDRKRRDDPRFFDRLTAEQIAVFEDYRRYRNDMYGVA